jgi:hypothetical protein
MTHSPTRSYIDIALRWLICALCVAAFVYVSDMDYRDYVLTHHTHTIEVK